MNKVLFLLFVAFFCQRAVAQVSLLTDLTDFHYRSWTRFGQMENVTADQSGTYYFFLRNDGNQPEEISGIRFFDGQAERQSEGFRIWPRVLQPGQMGFIIARGNNLAGFRGNEQIRAVISTRNGQSLEQVVNNVSSFFRITNVMPAQDYSHLKIFFRNDDSLPREMRSFFFNGRVFDLAGTDKGMLVGGNNIVPSGHVAILIYTQSEPMKQLMPAMMSVTTARPGTVPQTTSAAVRLVDSRFHIGTWDSRALEPQNIAARKRFRELMIDAIHGQGNFQHIAQAHDDFFIASMHEVGFAEEVNARNTVRTHAGKPYIRLWSVDDEPDLSGRDMTDQALRSRIYWEEDSLIPSFVNLAVQKKYNRYGWYTDIVGMDHYAAPTAPNIIPLTWVPVVGRSGELVEALEYSEVLKFNTEPRRNWSWVQMAPGPWSQEPFDWSINIQFWLHIMGGAKSMEFFVAQTQTKERWPAQWEAARVCVKQLASIRNLVLENEYANIAQRGTPNILTRTLVGPESMLVFAVNNTARFSWNGSFDPIRYNGTLTPTNYTLEFDMPAWISPADVYRVGVNGEKLSQVNLQSLGNGRYRISSTEPVHGRSHVFVISNKVDNEAPHSPIRLHAVDIKDSANYTLSWDVPYDNVGILGYDIFRNGELYANVGVPVLEITDGYLACPEVIWEAVAIDPSGNRSIPAVFKIMQPVDKEAPLIVSGNGDQEVQAGTSAVFEILVEGEYDSYMWQYNSGSGWQEIRGLAGFSGAETPVLTINAAQSAQDAWLFRCVAVSVCFGKDTSEIQMLKVRAATSLSNHLPEGVEVFPNPTADRLIVKGLQTPAQTTIGIFDLSGREMINTRLAAQSLEMVDVSAFPAGVYLLQIKSSGKLYYSKFLKE